MICEQKKTEKNKTKTKTTIDMHTVIYKLECCNLRRNQNKNFEEPLQDYLPFIEIGNQIPPLFCFSFDNLPDIIATFQLQRRYVINDRCLT